MAQEGEQIVQVAAPSAEKNYTHSSECEAALEQLHSARKKVASDIADLQKETDGFQGRIDAVSKEIDALGGGNANNSPADKKKKDEMEKNIKTKRDAVAALREKQQAARDLAADAEKVDPKTRTQSDREKLKKRAETLQKLKPDLDKANADLNALLDEQRKLRDAGKPTEEQKAARQELFDKRSKIYDEKKLVQQKRSALQKEREVLSEQINELTEIKKKLKKSEYWVEKEARDAWWWDMTGEEQKVWYDMEEDERNEKMEAVRARMAERQAKAVAA